MKQAVRKSTTEPQRRLTLVERSPEDRSARLLAHLFDTQAAPLYRFIYGQVGNRADAEALTTRTFEVARQRLDPAHPDAARPAWLFTLAHEQIAAHWQDLFPTAPAPAPRRAARAALAATDPDLPRRRLLAQLDHLPAAQRQVLTLRLLDGCSLQETAAALGCTPAEVKARQYAALQAVQHLEN